MIVCASCGGAPTAPLHRPPGSPYMLSCGCGMFRLIDCGTKELMCYFGVPKSPALSGRVPPPPMSMMAVIVAQDGIVKRRSAGSGLPDLTPEEGQDFVHHIIDDRPWPPTVRAAQFYYDSRPAVLAEALTAAAGKLASGKRIPVRPPRDGSLDSLRALGVLEFRDVDQERSQIVLKTVSSETPIHTYPRYAFDLQAAMDSLSVAAVLIG